MVFTHDDRLPEAVERLRIPARIMEVARRARSVVELRERSDPVRQLIADARAVAHADEMSPEARASVVPGLCRSAIEAGCASSVRRRRIGGGEPHEEVERALDAATTLKSRVALALFDDSQLAGEVLSSLNNRFGSWAADALQAVNRGAHQGHPGDLLALARDAERLATALAERQ